MAKIVPVFKTEVELKLIALKNALSQKRIILNLADLLHLSKKQSSRTGNYALGSHRYTGYIKVILAAAGEHLVYKDLAFNFVAPIFMSKN